MRDVNTIYLDRKKGEGNNFIFLSAPIPNISIDDNYFDFHQILLQVNDSVTMRWKDGTTFKGRVKPVPEAGSIRFIQLDGQRISQVARIHRITLSHKDGNIEISHDYNVDEKLLSNKTLLIKDDGSLSENDYWDWEKYHNLSVTAKWTYRNGNYLEGIEKITIKRDEETNAITINESISAGVFKYANGDRFEGNLMKSLGSGTFFYDGTTYFKDGSIEKGNWFKNFKLTDDQWNTVFERPNPTTARELAHKFEHHNNYPQYEYSGKLEYFDPSDEERQTLYFYKIIYDKADKRYTCLSKNDESGEKLLRFAVDGNGYRKWEIVYKDGKPKYINEFTWYSNGIIESIKSYTYDTRKLYLSCYFFSDGKLRSAYQYGKGNNGENVIRRSKESHPTFGGYTSKLYDLNGNYERSIEWNIGVGESLFGGIYDKKMAPTHLIFSKLKPVEF